MHCARGDQAAHFGASAWKPCLRRRRDAGAVRVSCLGGARGPRAVRGRGFGCVFTPRQAGPSHFGDEDGRSGERCFGGVGTPVKMSLRLQLDLRYGSKSLRWLRPCRARSGRFDGAIGWEVDATTLLGSSQTAGPLRWTGGAEAAGWLGSSCRNCESFGCADPGVVCADVRLGWWSPRRLRIRWNEGALLVCERLGCFGVPTITATHLQWLGFGLAIGQCTAFSFGGLSRASA